MAYNIGEQDAAYWKKEYESAEERVSRFEKLVIARDARIQALEAERNGARDKALEDAAIIADELDHSIKGLFVEYGKRIRSMKTPSGRKPR